MSASRSGLTEAEEDHAKAEVIEKRVVIGLSIAALVLFYFSIDAGIDNYKRFNKATGVASGQVVELREDDDEGGPSRWAHYQFNVDGIYYDGSAGNGDESLAKGDPVQVHYNPSDPNFNHAQGDGPKDVFFGQSTFWGAICLFVVFMAVRERRKQRWMRRSREDGR